MSRSQNLRRRPYKKPRVNSKRVQFMTNTFSTPVAGTIFYGPEREAPRRHGR